MKHKLTANATETSHKLATFLRFVCNDLEGGTKHFVIVRQPFQERLRLDQLHFYPAL